MDGISIYSIYLSIVQMNQIVTDPLPPGCESHKSRAERLFFYYRNSFGIDESVKARKEGCQWQSVAESPSRPP